MEKTSTAVAGLVALTLATQVAQAQSRPGMLGVDTSIRAKSYQEITRPREPTRPIETRPRDPIPMRDLQPQKPQPGRSAFEREIANPSKPIERVLKTPPVEVKSQGRTDVEISAPIKVAPGTTVTPSVKVTAPAPVPNGPEPSINGGSITVETQTK